METRAILSFLYSDKSFPGWVQYWGWDASGSALSVLRGADRVGALRDRDAGRHDVYITKNIMKRAHKRGASELFAYNAVVIDCDYHLEGATAEQTEAAADALRAAVLDRCGLCPSVFVRTGRGVQLWYLVKPLAASLSWLYEIAQNRLFDMVGDVIESEGLPFVLDESVKDAGRVVRLPGSWNYKAGRFGSWEIMERERYTVQGIIDELGGKPEQKRKPTKRIYKAGSFVPLCWKQKNTIERLCKSRESMDGRRNTALYLYGAAVYQLMDMESAADALRSLNSLHSMGLRDQEVESVISYYERHGVEKHCRVETFFSLLGMSAEEIETYKSSGAKEAEREAARERKAERDALILKYKKQGFNIKQIAEAVGVARGTVYAVLAKAELEQVAETVKKNNGLRAAAAFVRKLTERAAEAWESLTDGGLCGGFGSSVALRDPGGGLCLSG